MGNKVEPPREVIDYFEALGFKYEVITTSVYRDMRDAPVHFFQTDHQNHTADCSTIMADDAVKLFKTVTEPLDKRISKAFGERCENGHLRSLQPCKQCKQCKKPDGRSQNGKQLKVKQV
jgi:hypothetical protein